MMTAAMDKVSKLTPHPLHDGLDEKSMVFLISVRAAVADLMIKLAWDLTGSGQGRIPSQQDMEAMVMMAAEVTERTMGISML
jgi:hypothetical protein